MVGEAGWPWVWLGHGQGGVLLGQGPHLVDQGVGERQPGGDQAFAEHEGVGDVVDVLGRAGEMHELGLAPQPDGRQFLLEEVLDRLDVVVDAPLDRP